MEADGRDDWIRTSDLTHPKRARYQAAPRPDCFGKFSVSLRFKEGQDGEQLFAQIQQAFSLRAGKIMLPFADYRSRRRVLFTRERPASFS